MTNKELREKVNPIFNTGKGTASSLAHSGNKDAMAIVSHMDLSGTVPEGVEPSPILMKGFSICLEARYEITNQMILRENKPNLIDLPSGYTPRSMFAAKAKKNYIGFDLPVVAEEIGEIVKGLLPEEYGKTVNYYGVDATNYESMRKALEGISGEVCIATDGLIGYFNEPEIVSFLSNIRRILSTHGGCWITGDTTYLDIYEATFGVLFKENPQEFASFAEDAAQKLSGTSLGDNSLFDGGEEKALVFLEEHGFSVEKISFSELLADLVSLKGDVRTLEALREAYRGIHMWKMTAKEGAARDTEEKGEGKFEAEMSVHSGELFISLSGRLDTITAPELLGKYEKLAGENGIESITIDAAKLQYISSAGLRVLLIMKKRLAQKDAFHMQNVVEQVQEILETTGFDQLL